MKEAGEEVGLEGWEALIPGEMGSELWMERGRHPTGRSPEREAATVRGSSRRSQRDLRTGALQARTQEGPGLPRQDAPHRRTCRRLLKDSRQPSGARALRPRRRDEDLAKASPRTCHREASTETNPEPPRCSGAAHGPAEHPGPCSQPFRAREAPSVRQRCRGQMKRH